jgi:hypothetical protein
VQDDEIAQIFSHSGEVPQPDPREPSDPVFTEMVRLQSFPITERSEKLEPYFEGWLESGKDRLSIARYLAAAGLTMDQAVALEDHVLNRVRDEIKKQAKKEIVIGIALMAVGVVFGSFSMLAANKFPGWGLVLVGCLVSGAMSFYRGVRLMRRVTSVADDEIDPS